MTDGIKKGTGNSRYLKTVSNFLTLYPTYEKFAQALIAGTLPIDLNGINAAGWTTQGTALNKANLLADATATGMGLTAAATPNQAFAQLRALIANIQTAVSSKGYVAAGYYAGNGATSRTIPLPFTPKGVLVMMDGLQTYLINNNSRQIFGGMVVEGKDLMDPAGNAVAISIVTNGFLMPNCEKSFSGGGLGTYYFYLNTNNYKYHYIAIG